MKIIHADTDDIGNPLRGGQPIRTYQIASRLAARHDVTVFTSVYKGCRRHQRRGKVEYRRLGFRLPPFGLSPHMSFLAALGPAVRRTAHDLVVEEFTPPVGFCMLPWWTTKPVVSIVQWFFFDSWEKRYHLPFERWMRSLSKRGKYRHVITLTDGMAKIFRRLLPEADIRTIRNGLTDDAFAEQTCDGDYVLFLGRLDIQHKGLDLLLEAWTAVCARAGIPLLIAGEGQDGEILRQRVARDGLGDLVRFVGRQEGQAKNDLLRRCRLLAMPSRMETLGMTAMEAMAAGKPVVAFDIACLCEVVCAPWGVLVDPFDSGRFGQTVRDLWNQPQRCRQMGRLAQQEVSGYRWDKIARQQEKFYLEIVEDSRR